MVHKSPRKSRHRNHAGGRTGAPRSIKPQVERAGNRSETKVATSPQNGAGAQADPAKKSTTFVPRPRVPADEAPFSLPTPEHVDQSGLCRDPGHRGLDLVVRLVTGGVAFGAGYLMNLLPIPFATMLAVVTMVFGATAVGYLFSRRHVLPWLRRLLRR